MTINSILSHFVGTAGLFGERRRSRSPRIDRRERDRYRSRSRSRDRKKRRGSREREGEDVDGRRERRDRERGGEKDKKRKRSRSRERSERKREKRDKDRERSERKERKPEFREGDFKIKEEPIDGKWIISMRFQIDVYNRFYYFADYPDYSENFANYGAEVKYEDDDEKKFRPSESDRALENNGGQHNYANEDGEYDDRE